jgi:outer membrane receptor protein involved in Fe transport
MTPTVSIEAQEEINADEEFVIEEIVVTGTRIKRRDFVSPSPLVTVSREDLEFSGQPTLEEYLNKMPQMQPITGRAHNNGGDGSMNLNLRGMGPGRTLVLLNGRRIAPSGTGSAVDVNNLPSTLIERVEIITGGASTVYGSDAIAGVVNFITRDDFTGLSVEAGYNITAEGDANIWDANVVYGLDLADGGNITFFVGRYEREELFGSERAISSVVWSEDWVSGEWFEGGSANAPGGVVFNPRVDLGDGPVRVTWNPDGTPRAFVDPEDRYNYAPVNYLQTPLSRDSLGILGQVPLSDSWEAYFEAAYARNEAAATVAPAPYFSFATVNTDNPVLTPETQALFSRPEFDVGPGQAGMFLGSRLIGLGPRIIDNDREYMRLLAGLRGTFADGWELDAWFTYTDADEEQRYFNTGSISRIQQGLLIDPATGQCFDTSGGCVPVDLFGENRISPDALNFIRVDDVLNVTSRTQSLASVVVTGAPFEIWSGPVDMAFGVEWRRDEAHFSADDLVFTGDAIGLRARAPIDGTESVYELYAEAIFTLLESRSSAQKLELELGGRWSNYDNAGTVETWKAGLNWQVTDSLRFRTMAQRAVRAPNNAELFTAQFSEFSAFAGGFLVDPCSASQDPVGSGNVDKCLMQGLAESQIGVFEATPFYPTEFVSGGNPNLEPESSDTFTIGAVFNPVSFEGLTLAIDYYDLEIEDTIGGIEPDTICFDPLNTAGIFCDKLERDGTGNVFRVTSLTENRGLLATDGIDFQVQYATDLPESLALIGGDAQLSVGAMLTHVLSLDFQENIVTQVFDCRGKFGWPCWELFSGSSSGTYPENKLTTNFNYSSGPLTAHLAWRWIDGADNAAPLGSEICCGISDPVLATPQVPSWSYFDLGAAYEWNNGLLLRLGINNLFDKEPPLMGDGQLGPNTDELMYDVFGRTYYLNLRYQFGF